MKGKTLIKILGVLIFSYFLLSCDDQICIKYANNTLRPKSFSFKVEKKYRDGRDIIIEGYGNNGTYETFKEPGFYDLYHAVDVGDSIKKVSGKLNVVLIKNNKVIDYPCYCYGEIIE